jgi:hypothetical protein
MRITRHRTRGALQQPPLPSFPALTTSFYCQNIRNNENRTRTPGWVKKAGLVDDSNIQRRKAKNAWSKQFDERNNVSAHVGADLEEGEVGGNYVPVDPREEERRARLRSEGLWTDQDEEYYNDGELGDGIGRGGVLRVRGVRGVRRECESAGTVFGHVGGKWTANHASVMAASNKTWCDVASTFASERLMPRPPTRAQPKELALPHEL